MPARASRCARVACIKFTSGKQCRIRFERNLRAGAIGLADHMQILRFSPAGKFHVMDRALPAHFHFKPFRNEIDDRTHPHRATRRRFCKRCLRCDRISHRCSGWRKPSQQREFPYPDGYPRECRVHHPHTVQLPSALIFTSTCFAWPANASSIELSTIS